MPRKSKERAKIAGRHETARQRVIKAFSLTPDELARISTTEPDDPVSAYAGDFALQARMIADEREETEGRNGVSGQEPVYDGRLTNGTLEAAHTLTASQVTLDRQAIIDTAYGSMEQMGGWA